MKVMPDDYGYIIASMNSSQADVNELTKFWKFMTGSGSDGPPRRSELSRCGIVRTTDGSGLLLVPAEQTGKFELWIKQSPSGILPQFSPSQDVRVEKSKRPPRDKPDGGIVLDQAYLGKTADQRHPWAFGAIAELIHNSSDADATKISVNIENASKDPRLVIQDNGNGMTVPEMHIMMKLGRDQEVTDHLRSGRYGMGFKTGSMRLAKHAIVISHSHRYSKEGKSRVAIGFLSREDESGHARSKKWVTGLTVDSGTVKIENPKEYATVVEMIRRATGFEREQLGMLAREMQETTGTKIIMFGLKKQERLHGASMYELDFTSDGDFRLWLEDDQGRRKPFRRRNLDGVVANKIQMDYSFRAYAAVMYRRLQTRGPSPRFPQGIELELVVRGHPVRRRDLSSEMTDFKQGRVSTVDATVDYTIGFVPAFHENMLGGLCLYSANCLIQSFVRQQAGIQAGDTGLGIVLLADLPKQDFAPKDNKQEFEDEIKLRRLLIEFKKIFDAFVFRRDNQDMRVVSRVHPDAIDGVYCWLQCDNCNKWRVVDPLYRAKIMKQDREWYCFEKGSPVRERSRDPCALPCDSLNVDSQDHVLIMPEDQQHTSSTFERPPTEASPARGREIVKHEDYEYIIGSEVEMPGPKFASFYRGKFRRLDAGDGHNVWTKILVEEPHRPASIDEIDASAVQFTIEVLAKSPHNNVLKLYFADFDPGGKVYRFGREYFKAFRTLQDCYALSRQIRWRIISQLAAGIKFLIGELSIAVPVMSPDTILITGSLDNPVAKLGCFEFSRTLRKLSPEGRSRWYYPPEMAVPEPSSDVRVHQYALALVILEVENQQPPFAQSEAFDNLRLEVNRSRGQSVFDVMKKVPHTSMYQKTKSSLPGLDKKLTTMLHQNPARRFKKWTKVDRALELGVFIADLQAELDDRTVLFHVVQDRETVFNMAGEDHLFLTVESDHATAHGDTSSPAALEQFLTNRQTRQYTGPWVETSQFFSAALFYSLSRFSNNDCYSPVVCIDITYFRRRIQVRKFIQRENFDGLAVSQRQKEQAMKHKLVALDISKPVPIVKLHLIGCVPPSNPMSRKLNSRDARVRDLLTRFMPQADTEYNTWKKSVRDGGFHFNKLRDQTAVDDQVVMLKHIRAAGANVEIAHGDDCDGDTGEPPRSRAKRS
jgi:hypothetical protein